MPLSQRSEVVLTRAFNVDGAAGPSETSSLRRMSAQKGDRISVSKAEEHLVFSHNNADVYVPLPQVVIHALSQEMPSARVALEGQDWGDKLGYPPEIVQAIQSFINF